MKFCNLIIDGEIIVCTQHEDKVVNLVETAVRADCPISGATVEDLLSRWTHNYEHVKEGVERASKSGDLAVVKGELVFAPPLRRPGTFRDFYAFEQHVGNARKLRGMDINPEWYQFPVFYFSNPNTISTTGADIRFPRESKKCDYELEVGAVLGGGGSDLTPDAAEKLIAGYVVLNDWTARDIQRAEMTCSMGPAKGKDFATSIGAWLVTPDELEDRRKGKGFDLRMTAKINDETFSDNNWSTIHYSIGEMIARASRDAAVYPGELFGSGTVGMGCLLERGLDHNHWLKPGDVVELEIERLGILKNRIVE